MDDDEESDSLATRRYDTPSTRFFYLVDLPFLSLPGLGKFPFYSLDLFTSLDCPLRIVPYMISVDVHVMDYATTWT
jgi:hypothetical protein